MSAVILAFVLSLALVAGIIVLIRVWWIRRKLARSRSAASPDAEVIEVEYTVVSEKDERDG